MFKETTADHVPWNDVHMAELISKEDEFPFDLKEVEILSFSGIDLNDHPDYCDAFIEEALYKGKEMTEGQLEILQDVYDEFVYDKLMEYIF